MNIECCFVCDICVLISWDAMVTVSWHPVMPDYPFFSIEWMPGILKFGVQHDFLAPGMPTNGNRDDATAVRPSPAFRVQHQLTKISSPLAFSNMKILRFFSFLKLSVIVKQSSSAVSNLLIYSWLFVRYQKTAYAQKRITVFICNKPHTLLAYTLNNIWLWRLIWPDVGHF